MFWFPAFSLGGLPRKILEAWRDGKIKLLLSPSILDEYQKATQKYCRVNSGLVSAAHNLFGSWQHTTQGERLIQKELWKTPLKYQLHRLCTHPAVLLRQQLHCEMQRRRSVDSWGLITDWIIPIKPRQFH